MNIHNKEDKLREASFEEEIKPKSLIELLYILISAVASYFLFWYMFGFIDVNESHKDIIIFALIIYFFGLIHLVGSNFISFFYNLNRRMLPMFSLPIKATPNKLKIFGCLCIFISLVIISWVIIIS